MQILSEGDPRPMKDLIKHINMEDYVLEIGAGIISENKEVLESGLIKLIE